MFVGSLTSRIWTPSSVDPATIAYVPAYVPVNVNVSTEIAPPSSKEALFFRLSFGTMFAGSLTSII